MMLNKACPAVLLCLAVILCTGCDNGQEKAHSLREAKVADNKTVGTEYYICEIRKYTVDHGYQWLPYKVASDKGVQAINEWISRHREAIARAGKVDWDQLSVIPGTRLYKHTEDGFSIINIDTRLPVPLQPGEFKTDQRWVTNYPEDEFSRLLELVKEHGVPVNWSHERIKEPSMFLSYPVSNE
jgi:hypothetical protein